LGIVTARQCGSTRKADRVREGKDASDVFASSEIIFAGTGPKFHWKPRGILVPPEPPSCRKLSSFSPRTERRDRNRQAACQSRREISPAFATLERVAKGRRADLLPKMWASADTASGFSGGRSRSTEKHVRSESESAPLQFFDVNGSVAGADRKRGAPGIQFSANGGMAQRAGNLNRDIQRDAAVTGVRVEHRV
jgi:hypothetical protein